MKIIYSYEAPKFVFEINVSLKTKCAFGLRVCIFQFTFSTFFFFFFWPAFVDFGRPYLLLWIVYTLFTYCAYTVHVLKNIKNGFHNTIYTFKNYFAIVFSVFSFQFSVIISSIQTDPILCYCDSWTIIFTWSHYFYLHLIIVAHIY